MMWKRTNRHCFKPDGTSGLYLDRANKWRPLTYHTNRSGYI